MTYLLIDGGDAAQHFLSSYANLFSIVPSPGKKNFRSWLTGAYNIVKLSKANDTIICWFDFQAVLCWWISKLTFRNRNIGAINLMLKDKKSLKNRVVSFLYKVALSSKNFKSSVTSIEYADWLKAKLNIDFEPILIKDVFHKKYELSPVNNRSKKYIFCGGRNGRDWDFMFHVAASMPEYDFLFVMSEVDYLRFQAKVTKNIKIKHNIPQEEFMHDLATSCMVCLPLNTVAPAGLIVMFQAAANDKLVLTSETVTTRGYINDSNGALLKNNIEEWQDAIRYYYENVDVRTKKATAFHDMLQTVCSEPIFVENLCKLIDLCNAKK